MRRLKAGDRLGLRSPNAGDAVEGVFEEKGEALANVE